MKFVFNQEKRGGKIGLNRSSYLALSLSILYFSHPGFTNPASDISEPTETIPHFNSMTYLKLNPHLEDRYIREAIHGKRMTDRSEISLPEHQRSLHHWLKALARVSLTGKEAGLSWIAGVPQNFNWKLYLAINPHLASRYATEQKRANKDLTDNDLETPLWLGKRAAWLQALVKASITGGEAGLSWSRGVPDGFNWKTYLTLNPHLAVRYAKEQKHTNSGLTDDDLQTPVWRTKRAAWLQSLVKVSLTGHEAGLSWVQGVPQDFNWKTYLALNPHLEVTYATEQKRSNTSLLESDFETLPWIAKRATWLQNHVKYSIAGKEPGLCWIAGTPVGFDWQIYLQLNPCLAGRFILEQKRRNSRLTNDEFRTPEWLARRAVWLQSLVKVSFTGKEHPLPWHSAVPKGFNWREYVQDYPRWESEYYRSTPLKENATPEEKQRWQRELSHWAHQFLKGFTGGTIKGGLKDQFKGFANFRVQRFEQGKKENPTELPADPWFTQKIQGLIAILEGQKKSEFSTPALAQQLIGQLGIAFLSDVSVKTLDGGFVSGKIYRIQGTTTSGTKHTYFLKYLRPSLMIGSGRIYGEIWNLRQIKELLGSGALLERGLCLVVPNTEGQYTYKKDEKVFTISPGAAGQSLTDIVHTEMKTHPGKVTQAFQDIGYALGTFQAANLSLPTHRATNVKEFFNAAKTAAHGDFHSDNVFWDGKTVSLIDVETLAYSFAEGKPNAPLAYDIFYLIQQAGRRFKASELKVMKKMGWKPYIAFIDGYISAFPKGLQEGLTAYFESCMRHPDQIKFTDIFKRVLGRTVTWDKKANDKHAQRITSALSQHLSEKLKRGSGSRND